MSSRRPVTFCLLLTGIQIMSSRAAVVHQQTDFVSGGKQITVEVFAPPQPGPHPGVLVLHGAGGWLLDGPAIRRFARLLAENGFEAFCVHYFNRTGTVFARGPELHDNFETWRTTVNDAVAWIAGRPEIDGKRIACFGYSLGAYLSLAQAAHDRRVAAVVELAGAVDREHAGAVKRLSPVLILHGETDERVPVERAHELEKLLQKLRVTHKRHIYPGEGHVLSRESQEDAGRRGVAFLQEQLHSRK